ncbi:F-actin-monooxygenase MICAL2 isoform X10 [Pelodiscus sinensis]|uniref:F-actin-monooxygenase MICAL2 isoform X10 n=1 Tax=Pelodiscus sinensis TaxID=13735 RepID=UPI003F6D84C1
MEENDDEKHSQGGQMFENFVRASTCKGTIQAFNILTCQLELDPLDNRNFYTKLKSKVTSWKAKALWNKLDKRASHKEYKRGRSCLNTKCLIVGGGPCGLRTAIELAFLGAKVVVVEKRDTFSRNNVLHLWPFTIHDLRGLGAKKFYGKFCGGSIDHISIQQLQLILFKVALLLGIEIHVNVEFVKVLEPPEDQENQKRGWRAEFLPMDHPLSEFEFNVVIGADGRRNTLEGFRRKEFRGKLAIAITANFINRNTAAEAKVEEISGVAFIFNQKFFQDLKEETGIDLENIVYYKDNTHYFVMTAKKQSLLDKGVIINDYIDTEMLLSGENVNQDNLLSYAREAADFATKYQLPSLDFAINHYGQPDVAMFDFTSMYASENAALLRERHRHQLLVALVGDSLLEPFWPMGTGCARGFLAAFDTAWMVRSWDQGKPPLEILAERESIYRLLPQTTPENINKNFDQYTIDPGTRYPNLNSSCVRPHQVRHLYIINELQQCPLERVSSIRKSVNVSRHESDIRPNKLLTWCQKQTEGYRNVNVTDLTASWRSGLALCAIMHRFRPDLIDFDSLKEEDVVENNQLVFDMAERELGIPPVTTGKEMASAGEPDKLSMVMYLSKFYELFRGTPLRAVDAVEKQNGKNDLCSAKSSNRIFNNYINFTLPRKRVPKVERREENDMNKRRRKGLGDFEEASSFSSRGINSGKYQGDREGMNQNKVKSMATQLLAKFEENAPNTSLRRQGSLRKEFPRTIGGSDICYFCKKRVYVMERLSAEGHFFHRECFKCTVCSSTLRLTIYAFDVEEGKFYCKPHFTRCKTSNKYRKRPSMLKMQEKVETEMWTQEEPKHPDTTTESTSSTVSGPEDRPPDYYFRIADEPTSPKKPKNAPEHNFESRCSALSSNWTSVRIIPEEEMTEHDLLAVRVMVTSDGSSSELESDFYGDSSNSEIREGQFWLPEPVSYTKLLSKHASQTPSSMKEEERREKSKAADALQRANSFHSSTLNKYQNWRRKMQSNFPLLYIKRAGLHSQESSARSPSALEDDISQSQLTSHNKPPEITRGLFKSSIPVFQRKAKAKETPEEICRYVPHYPLQNSVTESPLMHSGNVPSVADVHKDENGNKEYNLDNLKEREECTTRTRDFSRKNTDLSSLDPEKNERSPRQWREQPDLEIKKQIKNKLMLDVEQQSKLLDLRNADLNGTKLEYQSQGMLEISEWKDIDGNRRKDISKQSNLSLPLPFANDALPNSSADTKEILKSSDSFVEECLSSHPKSPLRLIANAIKRSVLEPLVSHSESTKKTPDSNANLTSEHNFFSSSNTLGHTVPSRENNSNREHDVQSQESNVLDTQHLVTNPSSLSTEALFPVSSLHTGFSKAAVRPQNSSDEKMDDVPRLLEKFNLEETPLTASTDDLCICNQENLFSSLRLKNKISKDILGVPAQMNDMCLVFSNFTPQMDEKEKNHSLKSSVCFSTNFPHPKVLNNSSTDEDSGSEHLSVKKQVVVCCCSSSDGEFEHKPPLVLKAKRTLKRRKLEKETKQLAKQEELKRLHKAQAIQRQLEEVEERQRALEINGVKLERELRGESDSGTQDETQLLHEWFELVLEKNKLIRYESELLIVAQELELEDHQRRLEQKLREKMAFHDSLKDEQELNEEHEIFTELIKVVEERDKLVSSLEEQRVKEKADNQQFESFILSKGYQLSRT